ncbi:MAG TPA: hypothetical protein VGE31_00130 [Candidatus Paceibacterota bacterium]
MKTLSTFTTLVLLGLFIAPLQAAQAASVVRTGETVSVEKDQKIEGDFYTLASILNLSGEITEDLVAAGGELTLNGTVTEDAYIIGGQVDVHGPIGEDLRVAGGSVVIAEPVTGDVLVIGGTVTVLSTASIGGDLIVYGSEVEVSGSVGGNIVGQAESIRVDAPVTGDVNVTAEHVVIGDRADVKGGVHYVSADVLTRAQDAKIEGDVTRNDPAIDKPSFDNRLVIIPILALLFSVLVWYMIARPFLTRVVNRALTQSVRPTLVGLLTFFASPAIIVILTVSVLGTLVGISAFFAYVLALLLAFVSASVVLGQLVMKYVFRSKNPDITPVTLGAGVLAITLCVIIPVLGQLILLAAFIVTLGALVDVIIRPTNT